VQLCTSSGLTEQYLPYTLLTEGLLLRRAIRSNNREAVEKFTSSVNFPNVQKRLIELFYFNDKQQAMHLERANSSANELENQIVRDIAKSKYLQVAKLFLLRGCEIIRSKKFHQFEELYSLSHLLKFARLSVIMDPALRLQCLFLCRYMGFKRAIFKGYFCILVPLYRSLKGLIACKEVMQMLKSTDFSEHHIDLEFYSMAILIDPKLYGERL
jgi:hypothetical protein